jgi:hypothetical protein
MISLDTYRDIIILSQDSRTGFGSELIITAVDSCGAIGSKPNDAVRIEPELAAEHTVRLVLLEVMSTGAEPEFASIMVCNEPQTAEKILAGVRKALGDYGSIPLVMSTEKNMATSMTAFGITITGTCKTENLKIGVAKAGDLIFCAGVPLVGNEMLQKSAPYFTVPHLKKIMSNKYVSAIIPCGSRGIAAEADVLATESGLKAFLNDNTGLNFAKSAGPASCAVFAANLPDKFYFGLGIPTSCIGQLL